MNNETEQIFLLNPTELPPGALLKLAESSSSGQVNLENVEDFSTVCRTCATITEFVIPIFSGEGLQNNLADKIHKHLPIKVCEEDALPRAVCYQCAHTLLAWHELVACSRHADRALRTRLQQLRLRPTTSQDQKSSEDENSQIVEDNQQKEPNKAIVENVKVEVEDSQEPKLPLQKNSWVTLTEDGKKYIECQLCKKSVTFSSWKRHLRSHHGEKRFSCHTCGLSFSDSGNLARHTRALHAKQRPHTCPICRKAFSRNSHLQDHIKSHSESREFVCDSCGKGSKSSAALRMHRKTHESDLKFECMECGSRFKRRGELRAHVTVHTGEKAHVCSCGRAFRLRSQLTAHSRTHPAEDGSTFEDIAKFVVSPPDKAPPEYPARAASPPPLMPCAYCSAQYTPDDYKEHLIQAHTELLFHCDECNGYVDKKDFILHMSYHVVQYSSASKKDEPKKPSKKKKKHKDENENSEAIQSPVISECSDVKNMIEIEVPAETPVAIEIQKPNNDNRNEFSDHSDTEFGFGPLPESVFEAIEDTQDSQPVDNDPVDSPEVTEDHTIDNVSEKCENDQLSNKTELNSINSDLKLIEKQNLKDTKEKKHKKSRTCPICGKTYNASSSYFYHIKAAHKKTRDYECEICGKKFWTRIVLIQHVNSHNDVCDNECKICGKKLKSKSSLYIHTQNHIGAKKFSCEQCQISFRWRTHLTRHLKRHAAEKNHVCPTCGKGFTVHCDLLRHIRTHSAGKFECKKCGVSFAQARYLRAHTHRKHSTQRTESEKPNDANPVINEVETSSIVEMKTPECFLKVSKSSETLQNFKYDIFS